VGVGNVGDDGVIVTGTADCEPGVRVGTIGSGVMVGTTLAVEQPVIVNITNSSTPATSDEKHRIELTRKSSIHPDNRKSGAHTKPPLFSMT